MPFNPRLKGIVIVFLSTTTLSSFIFLFAHASSALTAFIHQVVMSDDPAPSRSADAAPSDHSYGPLGRPYKYKHVEVAPRPAPKIAFGFVLGPKCRMRWARWYHEMANGDELSTLPPEEVEEILEGGEMAIRSLLPGLIYL